MTRRVCTFVRQESQQLLKDIEQYINNNAHCNIDQICSAFEMKEPTIRNYMTELWERGIITHDPVIRREGDRAPTQRTWISGDSGIKFNRIRNIDDAIQVSRVKWPKGSSEADPLALPRGFFKVG